MAGCRVQKGQLDRRHKFRLLRGQDTVWEGECSALRRHPARCLGSFEQFSKEPVNLPKQASLVLMKTAEPLGKDSDVYLEVLLMFLSSEEHQLRGSPMFLQVLCRR